MDNQAQEHVLKVRGMTCATCEERVAGAALSVPGVVDARAQVSGGRLTVTLEPGTASTAAILEQVRTSVASAGYTIVDGVAAARIPTPVTVVAVGAGMIGLALLLNSLGLFRNLPTIDPSVGLGMIFVAGLLTSFHCVAMCGGIALTQSRSSWRGLDYHLGRVLSYTALGALVGALGAVISFSPLTKGILAGVAGLFMVGMGLQMVGLLPRWKSRWLARVTLRVPLRVRNAMSSRGPFFVGLLNGLMPCGPLQTMQLYALGTGSALWGALSMFLFSLGTVPLLFAFGSVSHFFSTKWQHRLVRGSAILVIFLGIVMAGRALDLSGASGQITTLAEQAPDLSPLATVNGGVQVVSFDLEPGRYAPITVQKGIPVEWTINATEDSLNGCNGEIVVPQLGLKKKLSIGANLIRFTPTSTGTITYTCWMGMISSSIRVVDTVNAAASQAPSPTIPPLSSNTRRGRGIATDLVQKAEWKTEKGKTFQEVTVTVDEQGYTPAVLVVQKGVPTRFTFVVKKLTGCNSYVDFPAYGAGLDLSGGQLQTPLLPVVQDFVFQCGMAMIHGYVRVVSNLSAAETDEARAAAASWVPTSGGGGSCCER